VSTKYGRQAGASAMASINPEQNDLKFVISNRLVPLAFRYKHHIEMNGSRDFVAAQ